MNVVHETICGRAGVGVLVILCFGTGLSILVLLGSTKRSVWCILVPRWRCRDGLLVRLAMVRVGYLGCSALSGFIVMCCRRWLDRLPSVVVIG